MDSSNSSIDAASQPHSSPSTHLSIIDSNSQTISLPGLSIKLDWKNYYLLQSTVYSTFDNNPSRSSNRSSPRIICQICEKPNHHARNCYNRNNVDSYPPNRSSNRPQANMLTPSANMMSPSATVDNSWFADSGATNHVTLNLSQLSIHTDYSGEDNLVVGNSQKLSIHHSSSSKLPCTTRPINLNEILHVPSITKSLRSVSQFTKNNNVFMEFHPSYCFVIDPQGKTLLRGSLNDSFYRLNGGRFPVI
ncbi:hypothetical protein KY284_033729 [Solanum tuberosum]|nr:hypothetical protein KY284_033729 [Solanum tuberosum]